MKVNLSLWVKTKNKLSQRDLVEKISFALNSSPSLLAFNKNEPKQYEIISNEIQKNNYGVDITFNESQFIYGNGLASLFSFAFGNTFRDLGVTQVVIDAVSIRDNESTNLSFGPNFGVQGVRELLLHPEEPLISYPMPPFLDDIEWRDLLQTLNQSGINIFTDSPLENNSDKLVVENKIRLIESTAKVSGKRVVYFLNGTTSIRNLLSLSELAIKNRSSNVVYGIRICPISMGLNMISHLKSQQIPVFGYLLFGDTRRFINVSPKAMASLQRLSGCDLINVGLTSDILSKRNIAYNMVTAATERLDTGVKQTFTAFTGNLTPQRAYNIFRDYHAHSILHMRRPLTGGSISKPKVAMRASAFFEAMELGQQGKDLKSLLRQEHKSTRNIRAYSREIQKNKI